MSQTSGNDTLDFFRRLWPEGHTYCIAVKPPGKGGIRQAFFASVEEAAGFAATAAARGLDAYHACAVFKDGSSRKATNVAGAKAFWLDVDAGAGKPYTTDRDALAALLSFCAASTLPIPTIIHSGGGWHAYWFIEETLTAPAWLACAEALKALCVRHGFHADPAITGDMARILRPPGTRNFKRETPVEVTLRHSAETVSVRALVPALQPAPLVPQVDNSKFEAHPQALQEPSYGHIVAENCKQLAHFRDTQGRLPEPLWYAGICLLAACEDGHALSHEWSKGDERYVYADTERKYAHAKAASGPTNCSKFQSLNPDGCVGCPHAGNITSPIQLGRGAGAPKVTIVQDVTCPAPPSPFKRGPTGALLLNDQDEAGAPITVTVYKAPLFLQSIREHELSGVMTLILRHWLPQEGWLETAIPWSDRSQKTVINAMAAQKINVPRAHERDMLWFLERSIDDFQAHRKTEMEYAQFGWRNGFEQFVLGTELYTTGGKEALIGTTQELAARAKQMRPYGDYDQWRRAVQPLFVHEQQGLMVVCGFASVLMRFVQEMTGVIIAAVSPEPRLGKTMGLVAARSIWGDDNCIDIATNDTANSRFKMLSVLNGLPATWDDMRKSNDPEIIKQFVLSFSQGRDKNRLDRSGTLRPNTSGWSSILLATSNISIAELVGHDGETAQQARILEYRFQPMEGMKYSDGQQYERQMRQNRGTAGRRFISALMIPGMTDWLCRAIPEYVREFETRLARSDASFYASLLACVKAAGIILNRVEMLEFSTDRIVEFAVKSATGMGKLMEDNRMAPVDILTRFVNDNWMNALVVNDPWKPKQEAAIRQVPRGKLVMRYEMNPQRIYVDRNFFKEWCRTRNIMFRDLRDKLSEIIVEDNKRVNLGAGTQFSGAGQTTCFEIDASHQALGNIKEISNAVPVPTAPIPLKRVLIPGKVLEAQRAAANSADQK